MDLRFQVDTFVIVSVAAMDLVYNFELAEGFKAYAGAGPDLMVIVFTGMGVTPGVHAVVGGEYREGSRGFFTEVQPALVFGGGGGGGGAQVLGKVRAGINFYLSGRDR